MHLDSFCRGIMLIGIECIWRTTHLLSLSQTHQAFLYVIVQTHRALLNACAFANLIPFFWYVLPILVCLKSFYSSSKSLLTHCFIGEDFPDCTRKTWVITCPGCHSIVNISKVTCIMLYQIFLFICLPPHYFEPPEWWDHKQHLSHSRQQKCSLNELNEWILIL